MIRKLIFAGVCLSAMLAPAARAEASSTITELNVSSLTNSLQNATLNFSGWSYRSQSDADNGAVFDSTMAYAPNTDASVLGVSALTSLGHAQAASNGGKGIANADMQADFSLAAGAHVSFYVPYSVTLHSGYNGDFNQGSVWFEIRNTADYSVVYNRQVSFDSGDLKYRVVGGTDSQSANILVDFYNTTGSTATYNFFGRTNASSNVSAVPEPATYLMLLVGIVVLVGLARGSKAWPVVGQPAYRLLP